MRREIIAILAPLVGDSAAHVLAPTWFTFIGLAGLAAGWLALRRARSAGMDPRVVARALAVVYLAAVLGGILGPMVLDFVVHYVETGRHRIRWAGMTSFAGIAAGAGAAFWYLRRAGICPLRFGDLLAAPAGVGLVFARLGCFVAGCDYGQVASVPWAVRFPAGSGAWRDHVASGWLSPHRAESLPVHPTQLYEAALGIAIFAGAVFVARSAWARRKDGRVLAFAVIAYAVGRFGIELLRGDAGRGLLAGASTGQLMCGAMVAAAGFALLRRRAVRVSAIATLALLVCAAGASAQSQGPRDPYDTEPTEEEPQQPRPRVGPAPAPPAVTRTGPETPQTTPPQQVTAPPEPIRSTPLYEVGLMVGGSSAFNRRDDQVPALGGLTVSGLLHVSDAFAIGADLDSMANEVAAHRSVLLSAEVRVPATPSLSIGLRGGLGATMVDFDDPAFSDVLAPGVRVSATTSWAFSGSWSLVAAPIAFDVINNREIGGAITAYQFRIGVAYRHVPEPPTSR